MTGTGIPLDTTESHHTLTRDEKKKDFTKKQEKQRSCLMKFTGFGAAGRARDRITDDEVKARPKKPLSA